MEKVLVTNTTDKDQSIIDIKRNETVIISPGAGYIIDEFNFNNIHMYSSYARRGMKVEKVDDSFFNNVILEESNDNSDDVDNTNSLEEIAENESDRINEWNSEEKSEVSVVEDKPKRRSKKSNKNVSEMSEEVSATSESGE